MTPENTELIQKSIYTLVFTLKNIEVRSLIKPYFFSFYFFRVLLVPTFRGMMGGLGLKIKRNQIEIGHINMGQVGLPTNIYCPCSKFL